MKLVFIKLPKKEHSENVAGKSSAKISLARDAPKRTYPDKTGVSREAKEVLTSGYPKPDWSTDHRANYEGNAHLPGTASLAAGMQVGSKQRAEVEGDVKAALTHSAAPRTPEYASAYELMVGRKGGDLAPRGGAEQSTPRHLPKPAPPRTDGAGLATELKQAMQESSFSRTLHHLPGSRRPPRPWEDPEDVEQDEGLAQEVRIGENAKAMARRSRRKAKKILQESHANPTKRTAFDEQAALSARRSEQEAFWRKVLKRNGHWVCGSSDVTTTVGTGTTLTTASTSAAGNAPAHTGKEFNYGKLTLPGDTVPKTRDARPTCPWEPEDDLASVAASAVSTSAAPRAGSVAAASAAASAKGSTAARENEKRVVVMEAAKNSEGAGPRTDGKAKDADGAAAGKMPTLASLAAAQERLVLPKRTGGLGPPGEEGKGLSAWTPKMQFREHKMQLDVPAAHRLKPPPQVTRAHG